MEEYKLSDIAEVRTGPFGSQLHNEDYVSTGTPIVTVEHLGNRRFSKQNLPLVSDDDKKRLSKYLLQEGDIVFSRVGSVDRCSYVTSAENDWLFSGRCLRVRCGNNCHPLFLYYYFCKESVKQYIKSIAVGATMPSINTKLMAEIPILLPKLEEQRCIADILSSFDDKIELNRRINDNLEQQAQALFKSWFVDGTNIELNYHELGNITSITAGGDKPSIYSKELTEKYYTPIYSNGIENEGLYGYTDFAKINSSSITISARGTIGYICLRTKPYVPIVRLISVIPKKEELSAEYLYLWALRQNFSATGTTQQQLTVPNLKKISIGIPAKEILKKFNNIVIPIFQSIEKNKDENKNLAQLRDTLLPKLMSGELKLSEIKTKLYE